MRAKLKGFVKCPLCCQRSHVILVAGVVVVKVKNKEPVERTQKCSVKISSSQKYRYITKQQCMYVNVVYV